MPWARFDDRFPSHRKIRLLSDGAFRLFVSAVCWSAENLTDGAVSTRELRLVADVKNAPRRAQELVDAGLWEAVPGTGWRIHDYLDYQPSAEQVRAERKAKTARQQRWRDKQRQADDAPPSGTGASDVDASTDASRDADGDSAPRARMPGPARPGPNPPKGGEGVCAPTGSTRRSDTRRTPVPADFDPTPDSLRWAEQDGHLRRLGGRRGLLAVTAAFVDWHRGHGTQGTDWEALWRKWIREQRDIPAAAQQGALPVLVPLPGGAGQPLPARGPQRPSTADQRSAAAFALAAQLRAQEGRPS
jgi:hypothetical protein